MLAGGCVDAGLFEGQEEASDFEAGGSDERSDGLGATFNRNNIMSDDFFRAVNAIDRDTQNLGISRLELRFERVQAGDFDASCGGEVERVEYEKNVLLTLEARQLDLGIKVAFQLEVGCLCACIDHNNWWVGDGLSAAIAARSV